MNNRPVHERNSTAVNNVTFLRTILLGAVVAVSAIAVRAAEPDRTILPIKEPSYPAYRELDVRNTQPPPRFQVTAPKGAPNVVIILIDDLGFGATTTFGGPIPTPTFDRLAKSGLRYNNFHTTALCSPTRVALKCGRNHHTAIRNRLLATEVIFSMSHFRSIVTLSSLPVKTNGALYWWLTGVPVFLPINSP